MRTLTLTALLFVALGATACAEEDDAMEPRLTTPINADSLDPVSTIDSSSALDSLFRSYEALMIEPDTFGARMWVDSLLASMSLEEKIGQLFIVHLSDGSYSGPLDSAEDAVRVAHVGGFLVPRLLEPREVFESARRLQRAANIPLFIAADYERGVGRFNNALTELPSNMAIGATRDTVFAAAAGRLTAIESRAIGVNLLFAPVVDVNNNPDNPIINIRSYGSDPELVGRMAAAFVEEAERHGLMTTLKHFPGHGDTDVDTHARMGVVRGDLSDLEQTELMPYRIVMNSAEPTAVMSAHLWIPAIEEDPVPATFSAAILSDLLRGEIGFDGIVVTDDIRMGALQSRYDPTDRILRPLQAGADLILTPDNLPRAIGIVEDAVRSGVLSRERLDESVRRILTAKASAGLHRDRIPDEARLDPLLEEPLGAHVAQAIADRSITLLKTAPVLPLEHAGRNASVIHITNVQHSESIPAAIDLFDELLGVDESARFDQNPSEAEIARTVQDARDPDVILLALYLRLQAGRGEAGLLPRQDELVRRLIAADTPVVLITFGNPYAASEFRESDAIVVAYDQSLETVRAAAQVVLGRQPAPGRLPIEVQPWEYGSGTLESFGGSR